MDPSLPMSASLGIAGTQRALTADYPDERWHQVIAINLTGVWLCMKYDPTLTPARYTTGIIIDKIIAYEIWA